MILLCLSVHYNVLALLHLMKAVPACLERAVSEFIAIVAYMYLFE